MTLATNKRRPINYIPDCPGNMGGWKERHLQAINFPKGCEIPVVNAIAAWLDYANEHERRYESPIGDDGVLGQCWLEMGRAIRGLLNGETGRLDCGTLDAILLDSMIAEGFSEA